MSGDHNAHQKDQGDIDAVDLLGKFDRLQAERDALLAVAQELEESAAYWSDYDVPIGIVDRLRSAIAKATGDKATAAWADVPDATAWLEDLRGNTGEPR